MYTNEEGCQTRFSDDCRSLRSLPRIREASLASLGCIPEPGFATRNTKTHKNDQPTQQLFVFFVAKNSRATAPPQSAHRADSTL